MQKEAHLIMKFMKKSTISKFRTSILKQKIFYYLADFNNYNLEKLLYSAYS